MVLLPAFTGPGILDSVEEDEFTDDDDLTLNYIPMEWIGTQIPQFTVLLKISVSIFALFVVYLGGRSKNRRFNDRTLDLIKSLIVIFPKTALFRAVFNFLLFGLCLDGTNYRLATVLSPQNPYVGGINP